MNARPDLTMSREEFKAWIAHQPGKREWVRGRVTMMVQVSNFHGRVLRNLMGTLIARLDLDRWDIQAGAFGADLPDSLRYPDVLVEPLRQTRSYEAEGAIFIAEIQSPSSIRTDMIDKPAEYFTIPTLGTYLVLSQDGPIAWAWQHRADGSMPKTPDEIVGRAAEVPVPALGTVLPMAEIYRGLPDLP